MATRRRRPERFLNRELSWLDFNERVVALAEDPTQPLLERAKFCAIFSSNLDEFFQVRVAGLKDQVAAGVTAPTPDGRSPMQQLVEIRDRVEAALERQRRAFTQLVPRLAAAGVGVVGWADLDRDERKILTEEFIERIFPVLTPLAVDPSHPFPYISDLSLNLAVVVRRPDDGEERFARVKVPPLLPRFVAVGGDERFVPVDEVIAEHVGFLFPGMEIVSTSTFRVTRNADLTLEEEEADDLLAAVEMELRRRRFQRAVRLEVSAGMPADVLDLLINELELDHDDVYVCDAPLDLAGLWGVAAIDRPDLKHEALTPSVESRLFDVEGDESGGDVFSIIRRGDVLVHHPYVSFVSSVEAFIARAAADPRVMAIKMTLYRTSGDSPIVASLIRAAEEGKQVVALVELKARFDERANIGWARRLEEAGVHVVYGLVGLKTHGKVVLVIRDDPDALRRYCHVGTGNYNSRTARTYEDLGLFTADPDVGNDLIDLFNFLTGFGYEPHFSRVLVAPHELRPAMLRLIDAEQRAGRTGRIVMKMNSLVDPAIIEALYAASGAGVQIDLIVRGICCLVPGVRGQSENIRVRSLVGRYLEHSRIFHFANGEGAGHPAWYIGSADLMPRNLDRRVEVLVPVVDPQLRGRLQRLIDVNLADDTLAWTLGPDGCWQRVGGGTVDTHLCLHELTAERFRAR